MSYYFSFFCYNSSVVFSCFSLLFIFIYEVINGFHDSANAIALIIYTRSMNEKMAILISGILNFLGVFFGGLSIAYAIIYLLPSNLLLNINTSCGLKAIFSILLSAILWNLCTWYLSLPTSSSHTLIGSIIGINFVNAFINNFSILSLISFNKIIYVFLSLILSPICGLIIAGSLVFLLKKYYNSKYKEYCINISPVYYRIQKKKQSLLWIKITLILSSFGISYFHGANDGQKGIGLIMLVLICIFPSKYLINLNTSTYDIINTRISIDSFEKYYLRNQTLIKQNVSNIMFKEIIQPLLFLKNIDNTKNDNVLVIINFMRNLLHNISSYKELNVIQCHQLRQSLLCIGNFMEVLSHFSIVQVKDKHFFYCLKKNLLSTIEYAPNWVVTFIALSLSIGTIIGWRRITNTFQNKLGTQDITYAQAISAQLTTACSVSLASCSGIPVSTTHIMSSSLVGTMLVNRSGLRINTIKKTIIIWILTIPISMLLASFLYWISLKCFN
ncbi:putative phosphate transporter [Buchnera aphidicola str. Bp (Baizongia pistaciae)]|uniref:Low-affinity inorganic phosphate transporter n=1 Tax=Buchnera aphidicola subsp. Baizongia pistaciae (strain Bp) TaxID=224915 RepID=PIT_BUCBP|nr:inorganic phosphate transporter [Buchnera aphidicola]Q89A24.1 RecName: Full=Low-affinity inorganic phosphate transporter [Buchnera aphidicola str. Bp (Baizongia pistaciae)]AAO27233.1 putative phosphate transporter [Buchnera aphidicola str. Bp (Baizongia pistaciae)]